MPQLPIDILRGYGIDEAILTKIKSMLDEDSDRLRTWQPANRSAGRFGGSATGADLSSHASTAHQHVVEALDEMVAGLRGYYLGVSDFGRHVFEAEDATTADLNRVLQRTDSATQRAGGNDFRDHGPAAADQGGA